MNIAVDRSLGKSNAKHHVVRPDHEVVIIGAGISGIGAAIQLQGEGIEDFLILERSSGVGGTWRHNRYPGIAVDITSFTYSYSFEQNPNWSRFFAPGCELQNYVERVAAKYRIYEKARFNVAVTNATFDDISHVWTIELNDGASVTARHLVSATGGLINAKRPDIDGLDRFQGKIIHTAEWDEGIDLSGKRVAVIGTGATAVQLVPELARKVARLDVYQRTPIWVLKKPDRQVPAWTQSLFRWSPLAQRTMRVGTDIGSEALMVIGAIYYRQFPWIVRLCERAAISNMKDQLPGREDLWEKLTPRYGFLCKRPTFSNEYFSTFGKKHVGLVTTPIERVTENGIVTADGVQRDIDVLILATGYKTFEKGNLPSYPVHGRGGREIGEYWDESRFQAYEGLTVHGFPNFYIMLGPYALIGTSYFKMVEGNAIHLTRCIAEARRRGATSVEIRKSVHDAYFADILDRQKNTVFMNHNCGGSNSYYFDKHGDAPMLRPSTSVEMLWRAKHLPMSNYIFEKCKSRATVAGEVA